MHKIKVISLSLILTIACFLFSASAGIVIPNDPSGQEDIPSGIVSNESSSNSEDNLSDYTILDSSSKWVIYRDNFRLKRINLHIRKEQAFVVEDLGEITRDWPEDWPPQKIDLFWPKDWEITGDWRY